MKRLREEEVGLLMQIVSDHYPNQQILHITDCGNDLHEYLFRMTEERGFEYDLLCIAETLPTLPEGHPGFRSELFDLKKRAYNRHAKLYEYVFVTIGEEKMADEIVEMLKKIFRVMKNSGVLIFLLEKSGSLPEKMDRLLEEGYFVAVNHIDIFKEFDVVNGRKMHGWGAYSVGF
ncbi:hypothetical protein NNO_1078 [Hydrogenimonas sp.]|nr:hypothetical protein NNO_1078 [Hydrogenimonas sp.]